jgi:trypsin
MRPFLFTAALRRPITLSLMGRATRVACLASLALALAASTAHAQLGPKIIGGTTTTIDQYPWQAAVVYDPAKVSGNPFQRQLCGGSLVTPSIVLTAGHCINGTDPQNNSDLDPDDVDVILGQTTLSTAPPSSEFNVQGVAKQPGYDDSFGPGGGVPSNDVGYLVLSSPYNATTPMDIAGPGEAALWDPGSSEQITGWGATATSGPGSGGSDTLRHATVPIVTDASCASSYGGNFNSATMVCAGFPAGGVDTCFGDSGGPMQAAIGGGAFRLVGITSWGAGCAQPNAPGVYTRVAGDSLRPAVASTVFNLETTFGLAHEDIVGGDHTPPDTFITSGPAGPTNDSTPTFGFSSNEPGSTFECRFDSASFAVCSGPGDTHTPASALANGPHTFEVRATDPSTNTDPSPASRSFTVDTQLPSVPGVTPDGTPPVGSVGAKAKPGGTIRLQLGCNELCTTSASGVAAIGRSRFKLKKAEVAIAAGGSATLNLVPKGQRAVRDLLSRGARGKATINVTFTDQAGNSATQALTVKLKQ